MSARDFILLYATEPFFLSEGFLLGRGEQKARQEFGGESENTFSKRVLRFTDERKET
jgi:hypothetical protein